MATDLIVNEIAIVCGAPGATDGLGAVYLGHLLAVPRTYQLRCPAGRSCRRRSTDFFNGDGPSTQLDLLQGDPVARVRDLSVAFGSLRTIRAEAPAQVPLIAADLKLDDGKVVGTITNQSDKVLEKPAVVLGSSAQVVGGDLAPGQSAKIDMRLEQNPFAVAQLSERIVGNAFFDGSGTFDAESQRKLVRRVRSSTSSRSTRSPASNRSRRTPRCRPSRGARTPSCLSSTRARSHGAWATSCTRCP